MLALALQSITCDWRCTLICIQRSRCVMVAQWYPALCHQCHQAPSLDLRWSRERAGCLGAMHSTRPPSTTWQGLCGSREQHDACTLAVARCSAFRAVKLMACGALARMEDCNAYIYIYVMPGSGQVFEMMTEMIWLKQSNHRPQRKHQCCFKGQHTAGLRQHHFVPH